MDNRVIEYLEGSCRLFLINISAETNFLKNALFTEDKTITVKTFCVIITSTNELIM